jgi:dynein heavy chain
MLRQALIPLKAYSKCYDRYTHLINLQVEQYIKDYEKTEKTIEQVRDEVKMHLKEKDLIEKQVPMFITIGPFYVLTSKLREALVSKRRLLAESILMFQTRKVKNMAEEVNNSFRDIQRKLFEKPNTMEDLHEHREWMKSIPGLLDDKKDDIVNVMEEFALLDEFLFNLSNEDFNIKWGLLSWQWKITNMTQQVEEQHVEEEERFRKLQIQDTANLNDKMDTLIMNVAGLSAHSNMDKAHEVANDCRRLNKSLKECQELAALYNNRERLFGTPITNVRKLINYLVVLDVSNPALNLKAKIEGFSDRIRMNSKIKSL